MTTKIIYLMAKVSKVRKGLRVAKTNANPKSYGL